MNYLAGLKKITALIAEEAEPLAALQSVLDTAVEYAKGSDAELCIPPDRLAALESKERQAPTQKTLGSRSRIVTSDAALQNALMFKQEGGPVAFEEDSHVVLAISCGTMTVYKPKMDTSAYTDQILGLKILADLADGLIQRSFAAASADRMVGAKSRENQQLIQRNMTLRELAMFDDLTGLYNRRFFNYCLEAELSRLHRFGRPFGIALFVLDYLENIISRLGHAVGDAALYHAGKTAGENIRSGDVLARWARESYIALFPETNLSGSFELADRIRADVDRRPVMFENGELHISVSAGVLEVADGFEKTANDIIRSLEEALARPSNPDHNRIVSVERTSSADFVSG